MRPTTITLLCAVLVGVALTALGQSTPPPNTTATTYTSAFIVRLRTLAGKPAATDCGTSPQSKPEDAVAVCGQEAFYERKPFFLAYLEEGSARAYGYGLAGDAAGNVFAVNYQLFPPFPGVNPDRHTRISDDNHIRITECIRPITLAKTRQGFLACMIPVNHEESDRAAHQKAVETSVCAILENPPAWNNKLVRLHGHYSGNFEYSMLGGDGCREALWFGYGGGSGPPSLAAYVSGGARPGSEDSDGKLILPMPITLVRDSKFEQFEKQVDAMAKADDDSYKKNPDKFVEYCVTATFTGRIDAVSSEVHEFRKTHPKQEHSDFLGFGQMESFDGQFILQSVDSDSALSVCSD